MPRERQHVRPPQQRLLVMRAPQDAVLRAGGDQERRGDRGAEERHEEDPALGRGHPRPALRERHGQQEAEQHLDARERDAQLVEKLDQLAVEPLASILVVAPSAAGT